MFGWAYSLAWRRSAVYEYRTIKKERLGRGNGNFESHRKREKEDRHVCRQPIHRRKTGGFGTIQKKKPSVKGSERPPRRGRAETRRIMGLFGNLRGGSLVGSRCRASGTLVASPYDGKKGEGRGRVKIGSRMSRLGGGGGLRTFLFTM